MGTSFLALDAWGTHFHTRPKIKFKKNQKNLKKHKKQSLKKQDEKAFLSINYCYMFEEKNPKKSSCNKVLQLLLCNLNPNPNNKADKLVKVGPTILWPLSMWEI